MPEVNYLAVVVAALVPSILGAIYYGPLFEKPWLRSLGKTKEEMIPNNMPVTYGLALLMAFILSFFMNIIIELVHKDVNEAGELVFASHYTFGHGAFHGVLLAMSFAVPVIVSLSLFQKSSAKNILLNVLFWVVCFALMGGILDAWK